MTSFAVDSADALRRSTLRWTLRIPGVRAIFVNPVKRIAVAQVIAAMTSLFFALWQPTWSLALGAAIFGVPHVLAGLRHTTITRELSLASRAFGGFAFLLAVASLRSPDPRWLEAMTVTFALGVAAELLRTRWYIAVVGVCLLAGATFVALRFHWVFVLFVTHLHALGSIAYFCLAAHRRGVSPVPLMLSVTLMVAAIAAGAFDGWLANASWAQQTGPDSVVNLVGFDTHALSAIALSRSLVLYAFGQAMHYAVWLRLMPEVDRPSPVPYSFRRALEVLRKDLRGFTPAALAVCAGSMVLMLAFGNDARQLYFSLVYFHIGLEAAAFTRLLFAHPGTPR